MQDKIYVYYESFYQDLTHFCNVANLYIPNHVLYNPTIEYNDI